MGSEKDRVIHLDVPLDTVEQRAALEQALLRARAAELGEVHRRNVRLVTGYGDPTTRDAMGDEADRAQLRWTMLDRLLEALKAAASDEGG